MQKQNKQQKTKQKEENNYSIKRDGSKKLTKDKRKTRKSKTK